MLNITYDLPKMPLPLIAIWFIANDLKYELFEVIADIEAPKVLVKFVN
ncbi:MAG: hypothetical protein ACRC6M_10830 [Microcystaceae cyanobacterium]